MKTIAAHTLGCKVNQYDTQAMMELFRKEGYVPVSFDRDADVYLVNTCTVTGIGDRKSLQTIRKIRREHPSSRLIVCGCMAQLRGDDLLALGADLVIGTRRRSEVVDLLQQVERENAPVCAVAPLSGTEPFERLTVSDQSEHTRAFLKIQEGCNNHCSYCIIPAVRGPIRSRPLPDILGEVRSLSQAGFREIVLTGIHLCSYGLDLSPVFSLLDAIRAVADNERIIRIRLGSLEPNVASESFSSALYGIGKVCPQFHLALQSGSDAVLARMRRRYNTAQFLRGVENLRRFFPDAAFTTDILTGFPGETEQEFEETVRFIQTIGFARIHVFPFSPRPDTPAAGMPGQVPQAEKEARVRELITLGEKTAFQYLRNWIGRESEIIPEEQINGCWEGYTPEYIRVRLRPGDNCRTGDPVRVHLLSVGSRSIMCGEKK